MLKRAIKSVLARQNGSGDGSDDEVDESKSKEMESEFSYLHHVDLDRARQFRWSEKVAEVDVDEFFGKDHGRVLVTLTRMDDMESLKWKCFKEDEQGHREKAVVFGLEDCTPRGVYDPRWKQVKSDEEFKEMVNIWVYTSEIHKGKLFNRRVRQASEDLAIFLRGRANRTDRSATHFQNFTDKCRGLWRLFMSKQTIYPQLLSYLYMEVLIPMSNEFGAASFWEMPQDLQVSILGLFWAACGEVDVRKRLARESDAVFQLFSLLDEHCQRHALGRENQRVRFLLSTLTSLICDNTIRIKGLEKNFQSNVQLLLRIVRRSQENGHAFYLDCCGRLLCHMLVSDFAMQQEACFKEKSVSELVSTLVNTEKIVSASYLLCISTILLNYTHKRGFCRILVHARHFDTLLTFVRWLLDNMATRKGLQSLIKPHSSENIDWQGFVKQGSPELFSMAPLDMLLQTFLRCLAIIWACCKLEKSHHDMVQHDCTFYLNGFCGVHAHFANNTNSSSEELTLSNDQLVALFEIMVNTFRASFIETIEEEITSSKNTISTLDNIQAATLSNIATLLNSLRVTRVLMESDVCQLFLEDICSLFTGSEFKKGPRSCRTYFGPEQEFLLCGSNAVTGGYSVIRMVYFTAHRCLSAFQHCRSNIEESNKRGLSKGYVKFLRDFAMFGKRMADRVGHFRMIQHIQNDVQNTLHENEAPQQQSVPQSPKLKAFQNAGKKVIESRRVSSLIAATRNMTQAIRSQQETKAGENDRRQSRRGSAAMVSPQHLPIEPEGDLMYGVADSLKSLQAYNVAQLFLKRMEQQGSTTRDIRKVASKLAAFVCACALSPGPFDLEVLKTIQTLTKEHAIRAEAFFAVWFVARNEVDRKKLGELGVIEDILHILSKDIKEKHDKKSDEDEDEDDDNRGHAPAMIRTLEALWLLLYDEENLSKFAVGGGVRIVSNVLKNWLARNSGERLRKEVRICILCVNILRICAHHASKKKPIKKLLKELSASECLQTVWDCVQRTHLHPRLRCTASSLLAMMPLPNQVAEKTIIAIVRMFFFQREMHEQQIRQRKHGGSYEFASMVFGDEEHGDDHDGLAINYATRHDLQGEVVLAIHAANMFAHVQFSSKGHENLRKVGVVSLLLQMADEATAHVGQICSCRYGTQFSNQCRKCDACMGNELLQASLVALLNVSSDPKTQIILGREALTKFLKLAWTIPISHHQKLIAEILNRISSHPANRTKVYDLELRARKAVCFGSVESHQPTERWTKSFSTSSSSRISFSSASNEEDEETQRTHKIIASLLPDPNSSNDKRQAFLNWFKSVHSADESGPENRNSEDCDEDEEKIGESSSSSSSSSSTLSSSDPERVEATNRDELEQLALLKVSQGQKQRKPGFFWKSVCEPRSELWAKDDALSKKKKKKKECMRWKSEVTSLEDKNGPKVLKLKDNFPHSAYRFPDARQKMEEPHVAIPAADRERLGICDLALFPHVEGAQVYKSLDMKVYKTKNSDQSFFLYRSGGTLQSQSTQVGQNLYGIPAPPMRLRDLDMCCVAFQKVKLLKVDLLVDFDLLPEPMAPVPPEKTIPVDEELESDTKLPLVLARETARIRNRAQLSLQKVQTMLQLDRASSFQIFRSIEEKSVFAARKLENDSRSLFSVTPELGERAFELDWSMALQRRPFQTYINSIAVRDSTDTGDNDASAPAIKRKIQECISRHYWKLMVIYRFYSSLSVVQKSSSGSEGQVLLRDMDVLKFDYALLFLRDCMFLQGGPNNKKGAVVTREMVRNVYKYILSRQISPREYTKLQKQFLKRCKAYDLTKNSSIHRHSFLEFIIRLVEMKYHRNPSRNLVQALERFFVKHVDYLLDQEPFIIPDHYRKTRLYSVEVDDLLSKQGQAVESLFNMFAGLSPNSSDWGGAHESRMTIHEWFATLEYLNVFSPWFSHREAAIIFKASISEVIDIAQDWESNLTLTLTGFMEALARAADAMFIPSEYLILQRMRLFNIQEFYRVVPRLDLWSNLDAKEAQNINDFTILQKWFIFNKKRPMLVQLHYKLRQLLQMVSEHGESHDLMQFETAFAVNNAGEQYEHQVAKEMYNFGNTDTSTSFEMLSGEQRLAFVIEAIQICNRIRHEFLSYDVLHEEPFNAYAKSIEFQTKIVAQLNKTYLLQDKCPLNKGVQIAILCFLQQQQQH